MTRRRPQESDLSSSSVDDATISEKSEFDVPDATGLVDWVLSKPRLSEYCAVAVEPLEIAARLETFGLSARVVRSRFGFPNVFAAAEVVYDSVHFSEGTRHLKPGPPMGRPVDLLRGALYAIPALLFSVVIINFQLGSYWWLLPVGLTVSWGTTQAFTVLGWSLRDREDHRSDALLAACSVLATAIGCFLLALVMDAILGGTLTTVAVAVAIGVYISASSVLVFHSDELLLLWCLMPALFGLALTFGVISDRTAVWFVAASSCLVVIAALSSVASSRWKVPTFPASTWRRSAKFLLYGVGCGLLTSALIGFATHGAHASNAIAIAAGPLLVTLGLMEWQLRSLRSRIDLALRESAHLDQFRRRARDAMARSITIYVGVLAATSVAALLVALLHNLSTAPLLIFTVDGIGISFFLALIFVSAGLIDQVLLAWLVAFAVLVATLVLVRMTTGHLAADLGILAVLLAAAAALVVLAVGSREVFSSPLTYLGQSS